MKKLTAQEIASALAGRPGDPLLELRLLMLFDFEPVQEIAAEPDTRDLRKAA